MAALVAGLPFGFAIGTGPGLPAAYALAGLTMLCFVSGYSAMSGKIVNTGALYSYIRVGLGRLPGASAAYLAVLSYSMLSIGMIGAFAHFAEMIFAIPGVGWQWYAAALLAMVAVLGRRKLDLSVWTLGVLLIAEVAVLVVMDVAIASDKGTEALPAVSFSPPMALGAGLAAAVTFAFTSFTGIESAPLYGAEARNPRKSVPAAGYWSVALVTVFYTLTSWLAVGGIGVDNVRDRAVSDGAGLVFTLGAQYAGVWLAAVMQMLLVTSFLASTLALHNATSRYLQTLAAEGLLPERLADLHPKHGSPGRASNLQALIATLVIGAFALAGLDPYLTLAISTISVATVGIIVLLIGATIAVLAYFARRPGEGHWWRTILAPVLALTGLSVAVVVVLLNFGYLTGTDSAVVNRLPYLIAVVIVAGAGRALWLRANRPERYAAMDAGPQG